MDGRAQGRCIAADPAFGDGASILFFLKSYEIDTNATKVCNWTKILYNIRPFGRASGEFSNEAVPSNVYPVMTD